MPNLPTLTIPTGPGWDRVLAAFHGDAAEYKAWLRRTVLAEVLNREAASMRDTLDTQIQTSADQIKAIVDAAT